MVIKPKTYTHKRLSEPLPRSGFDFENIQIQWLQKCVICLLRITKSLEDYSRKCYTVIVRVTVSGVRNQEVRQLGSIEAWSGDRYKSPLGRYYCCVSILVTSWCWYVVVKWTVSQCIINFCITSVRFVLYIGGGQWTVQPRVP